MTGLWATLHVRSDNISPPIAKIAELDDVDLWLWPTRSPDLTPKGFFLWSYVKALIYSSPVDPKEDFIARVVNAAATIRQQPNSFECTLNLCFFGVGCMSRLVAIRLNIYFKLIRYTTFFFSE
jgi:hypothetical protein